MKEVSHIIFWCLAGVVGAIAIIFFIDATDLAEYSIFAPKRAAIERRVFVETPSYNQGVAQELRKAQLDFARAKDPTEKTAIASYALHQTSDYDYNKLPPDLQQFVSVLQAQVTQ